MTPEQKPMESTQKPYAGRDALYARMQQQILDPGDRFALLFTGNDGIGKTRLLAYFSVVFQDTLLGVFIPPEQRSFDSEIAWLRLLIEQTNNVLEAHHFSLHRIPDMSDIADEGIAEWLRDVYLPEVLRIIRSHRRIVWLFDDAQFLLEHLPESHLHYLSELLHTHQQLAIVMTLHTRYEDRIKSLVPLVDPVRVERIRRLSREDSALLLAMYNPDLTEAYIAEIYALTAGHPRLLERYGIALQEQLISVEEATGRVFPACEQEFRNQWQELSRDEKQVLTAIASLRYVTPQETITAQRIHWWLTQSDYPLDLIAIHAVLRALDYRDIASTQQDKGIRFVGNLLERWMVEHARDDQHPVRGEGIPRRVLLLLAVIVALVIGAILMFPTVSAPETPADPTVTLAS